MQHCGGKWGGPAAGRGRHRHGFGFGGRHGTGGDDMVRAGRMLAHGDLRLIALALIAEQPRHGYEIMKAAGGQDLRLVRAEPRDRLPHPHLSRGNRPRHRRGRGCKKALHYHRQKDAPISMRIATLSMRCSNASPPSASGCARRRRNRDDEESDARHDDVPPLVQGAIDDLRDAAARPRADADAEAKVVELSPVPPAS